MSKTADRAISAAGLVLGAAAIGLPVGAYLARRYLATPVIATPAKPYSQSGAVATSISRLQAATRKGE
jgi:hypothetical protein